MECDSMICIVTVFSAFEYLKWLLFHEVNQFPHAIRTAFTEFYFCSLLLTWMLDLEAWAEVEGGGGEMRHCGIYLFSQYPQNHDPRGPGAACACGQEGQRPLPFPFPSLPSRNGRWRLAAASAFPGQPGAAAAPAQGAAAGAGAGRGLGDGLALPLPFI